jgi:hypothetical protein
MGYWQANLSVGVLAFLIAILGTFLLNETFGESLEFIES